MSTAFQPRKIPRYSQLFPEDLVFSSISKRWQGFCIEQCQTSELESPIVAYDSHLVAIQLSGKNTVRYDQAGKLKSHTFIGGQAGIIPQHLAHQGQIQEEMAWIAVYLGPDFTTRAVYEAVNEDHLELFPHPPLDDPLIQQIGLRLAQEVKTENQYGHLYAESLANTLAVHLIRNYSTSKPQIREYEDGLSHYQLRQAIDYIQAHLCQNIHLADVAAQLGMSRYYFCRLFRQSMGLPPYQYVIQQRIERSKQLLRQDRRREIADIALDCGFSSQSHLAKHFRQVTGTTPKAYRGR